MAASPLRVCLISQEFPPYTNWGGVGVQFDLLARGLTARGHHVTVISRRSPGAPAYERLASGVEVWRIGATITRKGLTGRTLDRMLHARAVVRKVAELERAGRFDVFEAPVASLDAERLVMDARYTGRSVICCHGSNFMGQAVGGILGPLHRLDWHWSGRREQVSLHRVPRVVVSSVFTRDYVRGQGVPDEKIDLIPLGIDTGRFAPPALHREGPLVVGFVGRLEEVKGIDFVWRLIDDLQPDAGIRFRFKGNIHPATRAEVLQRLSFHADIVEYHPAGSHEGMPDFFRSLDALLLPSRVENFGLTYAEAMATGLVVFAGRGGAGSETVTDGVTGFLVDPEGPTAPVLDRLRVLAADRTSFADMRRRARQHVVVQISLDKFIRAKEQQYLEVRES